MRALIVVLAILIAGCSTTQHRVITKQEDCAAQGGCVVVGMATINRTIQQYMEQAAQAGFEAGVFSCRREGGI